MLEVGDISSDIDPKTLSFCVKMHIEPKTIGPNEQIEATLDTTWTDEPLEIYCALFFSDGTFIMSDVDTTSSGKATCAPK